MKKRSARSGRTKSSKPRAGRENPYGGGPNSGISLPPYYRPTPSVANANTFFPGRERLGGDEMRITFIGSSPVPPTRAQAGTAMMVELGNGKRFFFDLGPGCLRNIVALQVPLQTVNDIFITHLHVDHYGELPYIYSFSAWMGRWKPLRVHGPSGRTPEDGTKAMIEGMKKMTHWHTDSFNLFPVGEGYEVEVNEFDYQDDNGVCYEKDGVVVRHWRRVHGKDGASAYRLDWNGLSFVWTGDGRPDVNTVKFAKGADVFVSELQPDTMNIQALKFGIPPLMGLVPIDVAHTVHYAAGYMFKQVQPRLAMATHLSYDEELVPEIVAGVRTHWDGLFQFGAPDGVVVNVTKKAIWTRKAALPESTNFARPSAMEAMELFAISPTKTNVDFPDARHVLSDIEDPATRKLEIDPTKYYPPPVYRKPNPFWPSGFKIDVKKMAQQQIQKKLEAKASELLDKVQGGEKLGQALQVAQKLGEALEAAKSPEDVLNIVQQLGSLLKNAEMLSEVLQNAQALGEVLNKAQGLRRMLKDAEGMGAVLEKVQSLGEAARLRKTVGKVA